MSGNLVVENGVEWRDPCPGCGHRHPNVVSMLVDPQTCLIALAAQGLTWSEPTRLDTGIDERLQREV